MVAVIAFFGNALSHYIPVVLKSDPQGPISDQRTPAIYHLNTVWGQFLKCDQVNNSLQYRRS